MERNKRWGKAVDLVAAATVVLAFAVPVWHFLIQKDYYLLVEAPCDPTTEACFVRDCSEEDSCPIGELEYFTSYRVHAADFDSCDDITCAKACTEGTIACEKISCSDDSDFECSVPEDFVEDGGEETEEESAITE